jgi:hypothetical protein
LGLGAAPQLLGKALELGKPRSLRLVFVGDLGGWEGAGGLMSRAALVRKG